MKTITHADSSTITYSYNGRATQVTDENGVSRVTQVDGLGRPTTVCEVTSAALYNVSPVSCGVDIPSLMGFVTTYTYTTDTAAGNASKVTVLQGAQTRTFETDWLGRTTSVVQPESGTTSYSYAYSSTAGLGLTVTRMRPPANQGSTQTTTTTQYDSVGRVVNITYSDGTPSRGFGYDVGCCWALTGTNQKGRLAVTGGGSGSTWNGSYWSYDAMGRVVNMWSCGPASCGTSYQYNRSLGFAYDLAGNLTQSIDGSTGTINYGRSIAGEVTSITNATYQNLPYNPPNLVSNVVNGADGPVSYTLGNGLNVYLSYDTLGRPNGGWVCNGPASQYCSGGTQIYGTNSYRRGSQMQGQADTLNGGITYGYGDGLNRLTSRTVTSGPVQNYTYAYDRYGNRVSQTPLQGGYSFNPTINAANNQITTSGYTYDAAGNMTNDTVHSYTYDAEGNITQVDGGSTARYVYDVFNQRIHVQTASATNEYVYDPMGRRVSSWLSPTNFGSEGRIYWDGRQIGYRSIDGTTYFDHQDMLGTERMRTTYSGAVGSTYTSLPWGDGYTATVNTSGADQDNGHYAGLDRDAESDTEHAQFRNYASAQGRWLAPDPYMGSYDLSNPQSMNRYAYVLDNPSSFLDPSGLLECKYPPCEPVNCNDPSTVCVTGNPSPSPDPNPVNYGGDIADDGNPPAASAPNKGPAVATPSTGACTAAGAVAGASAGALIGEGLGALAGGGVGTLVAPGVGTVGGGALGATGGATVGASIGGVLGGIVGNILCSSGGGATQHGGERLGQRNISQSDVDTAVKTAEETGQVTTQIGKYGTPQNVYNGSNGLTVVIETAGRNAGKIITAWWR